MTGSASSGSWNNLITSHVENMVQAHSISGGIYFHSKLDIPLPAPQQLPPDVHGFIGREANLKELDSVIASAEEDLRSVVISAVAGSPGVGKTALALHWAHQAREKFPDGQLYVNLHGYDPAHPLTPEQALVGFLRAFGIPIEKIPTSADALEGLYRSVLAGRRILVVLDNARDSEQIRPLLPGSPTCMVIVTSRNRLAGLIARSGGHRITVDVLPHRDAVMLLRSIIGVERTNHEGDATTELARLCAYLPLALRVAAERVASYPQLRIADLVQELTTEHDRLDALVADDDEPTMIRSVFSWSLQALNEEKVHLFRLLGLHPGPDISTSAAAALVDKTVVATRRTLDSLTSVHLLASTGRDRYQFHDLLRTYAAERAAIDETRQTRREAVRRILAWYLHVAANANRTAYQDRLQVDLEPAERTKQLLTFSGRVDALYWYASEEANLLAATRLAATTDEPVAWKLPVTLTDLLWRQRWTDMMSILQTALAKARKMQHQYGEMRVLDNLADLSLDFEQFDDAVSYFAEILAISRKLGNRNFEGWALNGIGAAHLELANLDSAARSLQQALTIFHDIENRSGESATLANIGKMHLRKMDFAEAAEYSYASIAACESSGNKWRKAWPLRTLGLTQLELGQLERAIDFFRQAIAINREFENRLDLARTLDGYGEALAGAGQRQDATEAWVEALAIFNGLGSPQAIVIRRRLESLNRD